MKPAAGALSSLKGAVAGAGFAALVAGACPAAEPEQAGLKFGPVSAMFHLYAEQAQDSNIYLTRTATVASGIFQPGAGLMLGMFGKRGMWMVNYDARMLQYSVAPKTNNAFNQTIGFGAAYDGGMNRKFSLNDSFQNTTDPASNEATARAKRSQNDATGAIDWPLGRKVFIGLEGRDTIHKYAKKELGNILDRNELGIGPRVGYELGPKTRTFLKYEYGSVAYSQTMAGKDNTTSTIVGGVEGDITSRITGRIEAGVYMRSYELSNTAYTNSQNSAALNAKVTWKAPAEVTVVVMAARAPREGVFNRFYVSTLGAFEISKPLMEKKLTVGVNAMFSNDQYPDTVTNAGVKMTRTDTIIQGGPVVMWQAAKHAQVRGSYLYRSRASTVETYRYTDGIATVGLHLIY
jgi:hypothetical protein